MTTVATGTAKSVSEQYGSAIAGVYDDIYGELDIGSPEAAALRGLALTTEEPRVIVELGVGTGRVLGALGRAVAGTGAARLIGIDGSADLLSRAAERYSDLDLDLVEADFSDRIVRSSRGSRLMYSSRPNGMTRSGVICRRRVTVSMGVSARLGRNGSRSPSWGRCIQWTAIESSSNS
ncbi:class I SAM-dependent methyltransferase [Microbacterium lacticum]